jgi:hypothetical protein
MNDRGQKQKQNGKTMKLNVAMTQFSKPNLLASTLLGLVLTASAMAGPKATPGNSSAFGATLSQWQDRYVRWYYGIITIPPDGNGNAVTNGVVLMPIPNTPGDGTPGHLDVTMNNGQAFFMPLLQLAGTSYTDGTPNDPFIDASYFASIAMDLKIDGVTVISSDNMSSYFQQFYFNPAIPFPIFNLDSIIWFQGFGFAHVPLSVGTHTMQLDEKAGQPLPPNFGGATLEWHNSWTITVTR